MSRQQIGRSLAKTAAATAFGGPVAGASVAVNEAIDLMAGWLGGRDKDVYSLTIDRVSKDLERLASSEGLAGRFAEQAMAQAQAIVALHGAKLDEMNELGLEPARVAAMVLARSAPEVALLDEGARELCRRAVETVYASLLADANALPGLEMAFRRAVLARLDHLPDLPEAVAEAVRSAAGSAVVRSPARRWQPELFAPSSLLRAEFGIVPFHGRDEEVADLEDWCNDGRPLAVRLYTGAGGMGKTRLMIELVGRLTRASWTAGFLTSEADSGGAALTWLMRDAPALLLVVDYAETRRHDVRSMLGSALATGRGAVRIVLLARARADWWRDLLAQGGGVGDLLEGPATSVHALEAVAGDDVRRRAAFESAARSFARALGRAAPTSAEPVLDDALFERVLFIHLAALAAVEGESAYGERALLEFALRREQRFWDDGVSDVGLGFLAGRPIAQAAAVATLAGTAGDRQEAIRLISGAPLLEGQPAAVVGAVAELLHRLYPGERWLEGVQPDLLGEHLVGRALEDDPDLVGVFAGA